jgi:hypothetical protein
MPRKKLIREYAIRLTHPILGEYYFNYINNYNWYCNDSLFMFTQELSKVSKRKDIKTLEKQISQIIESLKHNKKDKILIPFGLEIPKNLPEEVKVKIFCNRKRYYYPIDTIISKHHIEQAKTIFDETNQLVISDAQKIVDMISNSQHLRKDFVKIINRLENNVSICRKNSELIEKNKDSIDVKLDIVDASFGFRYLKLKTLNKLNEETENITS